MSGKRRDGLSDITHNGLSLNRNGLIPHFPLEPRLGAADVLALRSG
jgi:hypothetical protein